MQFRNLTLTLISAVAFAPATSSAHESIAREAIECNDPDGSLSFLERHFPSAFRNKIDGALIRCFNETKAASEYNAIDIGYRKSAIEDSQFRGTFPTNAKSPSSLNLSGVLKYNSVSSDPNVKGEPIVPSIEGFTTRTAGD